MSLRKCLCLVFHVILWFMLILVTSHHKVLCLQCPLSTEAWERASQALQCREPNFYHCLRDEKNRLVEQCLARLWIQPGMCPEYNSRVTRIDVTECSSSSCPQSVYWSNSVYLFPVCYVPETDTTPQVSRPTPQLTTGSPDLVTSDGQKNTTVKEQVTDNGSPGPNSAGGGIEGSRSDVGIIVGVSVGVAVLLVATIIYLWWRRRRKGNNSTNQANTIENPPVEGKDNLLNQQSQEQRNEIEDSTKLSNHKFKCANENTKLFFKGDATYLFAHPEHIIDKHICKILKGSAWKNVSHVIVDEAHCVVQWGTDFRPDFQQLAKLRSIFPSAYFVTMTATATIGMQKEISKILCMKRYSTISTNVDRKNVKIVVSKRLPSTGGKHTPEDAFDCVMGPFIEQFYVNVDEYPRTIVYTKLKWCGYGYSLAKRKALELNKPSLVQHVSQFHASCTEKTKVEITKDLSTENGTIKLLFATEAYGMGTDAPDVHQVIHIGPPSSLETYLQEIGRAGRDGQKSVAFLYFNMNDIGAQHVKSEVKNFCLLDTCRRKYISGHFGFTFDKIQLPHECCDICHHSCPCDQCFANEVQKNETLSGPIKVQTEQQTTVDRNQLTSILLSFFNEENNNLNVTYPDLITGLSRQTAVKIVSVADQIECEMDLSNSFPNIEEKYLPHIWAIISHCKSSPV